MTKQKQIITYASDLETIMDATRLFTRVCDSSLSDSEAITAFDTFHKMYVPMLNNYKRVKSIKNILDNFDVKLRENYPSRF